MKKSMSTILMMGSMLSMGIGVDPFSGIGGGSLVHRGRRLSPPTNEEKLADYKEGKAQFILMWNEYESEAKKTKPTEVEPGIILWAGTRKSAHKRWRKWLGQCFGSGISLSNAEWIISALEVKVSEEKEAHKQKYLMPKLEE